MLLSSQASKIWKEMNTIIQEMEVMGSSCDLEPAGSSWQVLWLLLIPAKRSFRVPFIPFTLSGTSPRRLAVPAPPAYLKISLEKVWMLS